VAREFKFAIHGEIDWEVGRRLLTEQAGADGEFGNAWASMESWSR